MLELGPLAQVMVILLTAVVGVSLTLRLGLGPVLGYLAAGILIGPYALGLARENEATDLLAEFGVVFLLFTVGLELPISRLKILGGRVLGLGILQIVVTGALIAWFAGWIGMDPAAAAIIGGGLALSSTAIVIRMLTDRGELKTRVGRTAFAVLLIQDLAVGPLLVCALVLGDASTSLPAALGMAALKGGGAVALILLGGRYVLDPLLNQVAAARSQEVFAATTLLLVLGLAWMTHAAGLSMSLGGFVAGMILADTKYRHQVAADIEPFRALLLGLFFITVGMDIDIGRAFADIGLVALAVAGLMAGKALVLVVLARALGQSWSNALQIGVLLAQCGEFAFVLIGAGLGSGLLPRAESEFILVVVSLTMLMTPLLGRLTQMVAERADQPDAPDTDEIEEHDDALRDHVVIAGYGRIGAAVGRAFKQAEIPFVAVDLEPRRVSQARTQELPVYFGDGARPEVLDALDVSHALAVIVTVPDPRTTSRLVGLLRYLFPDLPIFARAYDEEHAKELEEAGATLVVIEVIDTAQRLAQPLIMLNPASRRKVEAREEARRVAEEALSRGEAD